MINIICKGIYPVPDEARKCPVCGKYRIEKQLAEKEAMIDWLAGMCRAFCENHHNCNECANYPSGCPIVLQIENRFQKYAVQDWRKAAREAVEKNNGSN